MKKTWVFTAVALLACGSVLFAHPHFQKTTSATLPGDVEVSVSFFTVPSNMAHADSTANGDFVAPGLPALEISSALTAGSVKIPQGTYTLGAVKNGADDWTMALHPGKLGFNDTPDKSKLIKLESSYMKSSDSSNHLVVDIQPGHGKTEGKAVLTLGFGPMVLDGVLSNAE